MINHSIKKQFQVEIVYQQISPGHSIFLIYLAIRFIYFKTSIIVGRYVFQKYYIYYIFIILNIYYTILYQLINSKFNYIFM